MLEIRGNIVYNVIRIGSTTIYIFYDYVYHTELNFDGTNVTSTIKNYLNEVQTGYTIGTTFVCGETTIIAETVNGVASIPFSIPGTNVVRTAIPDIKNDEITITI